MAAFADLKGKTLSAIQGMEVGSEKVTFVCEDGLKFKLFHSVDCCESVVLDDIAGDVEDLLLAEISMAELEVSKPYTDDDIGEGYDESRTWSFYKLATSKGFVTLRWIGSSNGYYCETVAFEEDV